MLKEVDHKLNCRLCLSEKLSSALELVPTPIGDEYVSRAQLATEQKCYPLTVYQCDNCAHAQLLDVISPEILFRNYTFVTSSSLGLVNHFKSYAEHVIERFRLAAPGLVVEIGSNDGSLLRFFKDKGFETVGIDPAIKIAEAATASGILTLPKFFTEAVAHDIVSEHGKANLVCANNVYAHADDLREITKGVKTVLAPEGIFVFEVSYLIDILEKLLFDTIYHEHLCYHSILPLTKFFDSLGLKLFDVERISTKGGSIRCFVQHKNGPHQEAQVVNELLQLEAQKRIHTLEPFEKLSGHLQKCIGELHAILDAYKAAGKKVAGFGASVTATTLLYHFRLQDYLSCIVDDNTAKNGLFSPGAHIPVFSSSCLYETEHRPDVVVILAWAYSENILKKHIDYIKHGGVVIVPLPTVVTHSAS